MAKDDGDESYYMGRLWISETMLYAIETEMG